MTRSTYRPSHATLTGEYHDMCACSCTTLLTTLHGERTWSGLADKVCIRARVGVWVRVCVLMSQLRRC